MRGAKLLSKISFLSVPERSIRWDGDLCRDVTPWGRASAEISWRNNNRDKKRRGWLRRKEPLCTLFKCLSIVHPCEVQAAQPPHVGDVEIREAARRGGARCDRAARSCAPRLALSNIWLIWRAAGLPRPPPRPSLVRFERPAEPSAEWHVGQLRNRRKVGTLPGDMLGHMPPAPVVLRTKKPTHRWWNPLL